MRKLVQPPRPWHLLLVPGIPLLALLKGNLDISPPHVVVGPLLAAMVGALILWLILVPFAAGKYQAALAASLLVIAGLTFLSLDRFAESYGLGNALVPAAGLAIVATVVLILRSTSLGAAESTLFVNRIVLLTVLFLCLPIGWLEFRRATPLAAPLDIATGGTNGERPDIYVLVLDAYARADVLRTSYSFENPLPAQLRALGFHVAQEAMTNYAHTSLSLASALNLDYLPALGHPQRLDTATRRGLGDLIRNNRFFQALAAAGYETTSYASEYAMVRPRADHSPGPSVYLDEFGYAAFESSALPLLFQAAGLPRAWLPMKLHRHHLRWTIDHLTESGPTDHSRPALVFAHLLAPHPPFVFDEHGGARKTDVPAVFNDGDGWEAIAHRTGESYKPGYLDNLRFVNRGVIRAVEGIMARRQRPAIILIHSDHGPGSGLKWNNPESTDMRERMGILLAVRFPDGEVPDLGARTSVVNAYRALLNRALSAKLSYIEDRAFFSTWTRPFGYIDVTAGVDCSDCG